MYKRKLIDQIVRDNVEPSENTLFTLMGLELKPNRTEAEEEKLQFLKAVFYVRDLRMEGTVK